MAQSSRYGLPFLQAGQAQKEITHNDALARIDFLIQLAVESRHTATASDVVGTCWIVPANATGEWTGYDGQIAVYDESGWAFVAPQDGCIAFVRDESLFIHYREGQWRDAWAVDALAIGPLTLTGAPVSAVAAPSGGAVIDAEARTALSQLIAALRTTGLIG